MVREATDGPLVRWGHARRPPRRGPCRPGQRPRAVLGLPGRGRRAGVLRTRPPRLKGELESRSLNIFDPRVATPAACLVAWPTKKFASCPSTSKETPPMAKAVGIDLGTTNSVVAVLEGGDPVVIPN